MLLSIESKIEDDDILGYISAVIDMRKFMQFYGYVSRLLRLTFLLIYLVVSSTVVNVFFTTH